MKGKLIRIGTTDYYAERSNSARYEHVEIGYMVEGMSFPRSRVTVHAEKELGEDYWRPATINWSAIGSTPVEDTEQFAKALAYAVREAKRINKKIAKRLKKVDDAVSA